MTAWYFDSRLTAVNVRNSLEASGDSQSHTDKTTESLDRRQHGPEVLGAGLGNKVGSRGDYGVAYKVSADAGHNVGLSTYRRFRWGSHQASRLNTASHSDQRTIAFRRSGAHLSGQKHPGRDCKHLNGDGRDDEHAGGKVGFTGSEAFEEERATSGAKSDTDLGHGTPECPTEQMSGYAGAQDGSSRTKERSRES